MSTSPKSDMAAIEPMISAREAAGILGISYKTTLELAEAGKIPGLRLGWQWKFRKSSLDGWINDRLNSACPVTPVEDKH